MVKRVAALLLAAALLVPAPPARASERCPPVQLQADATALERASAARRAGEWKEAERELERARADAGGEAARLAVELERANLLADRGEAAAARDLLHEVERRAAASADAALRARAAANRLRSEAESAPVAATRTGLVAEIAALDALPAPAERLELLLHLGRSLALLDGTQASADAARSLERAEALAAELGDARSRSYALGYRAELYARAGRVDEALLLARRAALAAAEADAPESLYRWHWQRARLELGRGSSDQALAGYRDAVRTLTELREDTAFAFGVTGSAFESGVSPLLREYVDLLLRRASASDSPASHEALLREAQGALERLKAAELRDYFRDPCLEALARRAPDTIPGALVVYPIALDDRLELIASSTAGIEQHSVAVGRAALAAEVARLRPLLQTRVTREFVRPAQALYDWLVRPLLPRLAELEVDALVFVPEGALRTIPFAALRDRESGQFLVEQYPVAVVPGMSLTEPRPLVREQARSLSAGLTRAVQGYPALVGVDQEIAALRATFPTTELLDERFVESAFAERLAGGAFDIVHVASHGVFAARAADSFILTFDGHLALERLAGLVSQTRLRERPLELLVLSACDTAVGDERAALGLAGVAVRAGARSALATLWPVNDRAAARLIGEFYRQLAGPGASRARALQRAQQALLATREHRHPAYWSPYLLISSWL
jgi:CHAT domain-containing protein